MAQAYKAMVDPCTSTALTGTITAHTITSITHARTTVTALLDLPLPAVRHAAAKWSLLAPTTTNATMPTKTIGPTITTHVTVTYTCTHSGAMVHNL